MATLKQKQWLNEFLGAPLAPPAQTSPSGSGPAPAVSMHLPDEGPGANKPQAKPVSTSKPKGPAKPEIINFEPEDTPGLDLAKVSDQLKLLVTTAKTNANTVGVQILNACTAFERYADAKLDDVHDDASDLFKTLLTGVIDLIGGKLVEKVAEGIARKVAEKIKEAVKDAVTNGVMSKLKKSSKNKDLKEAITNLVTAATGMGTSIQDNVRDEIQPVADAIIKSIRAKKPFDTPEYHALAVRCAEANSSELDALIEELGVPSDASAKALQLDCYQHMVKSFELSVCKDELKSEMGKYEFADAAKMDPIGLKQKIRQRAQDRADAAREKLWETFPKQHGKAA